MPEYFHSVTLEKKLCKGCTNCIKLCPTQAIRVQGGKAKIIKERCIDCGVCIRVCPYHAKRAITDKIDMLLEYKYNVAMPAPAFYGQFSKATSIDVILTGLKQVGFDDVFEVAVGAEVVTEQTKRLIASGELETPAISSACPAVLRLITVSFPNLINKIVPIETPVEAAAMLARQRAVEQTGLAPSEIGIFFISPCAAKVTASRAPIGNEKSNVDGVLSIKDVYLHLAHKIGKIQEVEHLCQAGLSGVNWANNGGEAQALEQDSYIAVDGIENVIHVLEDIEDDKLKNILFVEALACPGGCVGGPLTVENCFVAQTRIKNLAKRLGREKNEAHYENSDVDLIWKKGVTYRNVMHLDDDMRVAMQKIQKINEITARLPQLDCGSCGAPTCRSLAEDIVRGFAQETDCIFKLRERVRSLAKEMIVLESQMPPSFQVEEETAKEEKQNEE